MSQEIVIGGGKRTPFGDFGKSLRDTPLSQLATHAANAALMDAKVEPTDVDHLVWGNVLPVDPDGFYTGRVAALNVGMRGKLCPAGKSSLRIWYTSDYYGGSTNNDWA